jgi:hypothetical protein
MATMRSAPRARPLPPTALEIELPARHRHRRRAVLWALAPIAVMTVCTEEIAPSIWLALTLVSMIGGLWCLA